MALAGVADASADCFAGGFAEGEDRLVGWVRGLVAAHVWVVFRRREILVNDSRPGWDRGVCGGSMSHRKPPLGWLRVFRDEVRR